MITAHPKVRIQYLRDSQAVYTANGAEGLRYATSGSVGLDLRACLEEDEAAIPAGGRLAIPSGIAVEPLTPGIAGFVYSRSGLGAMQGLTVAQGVGVIDPDYRRYHRRPPQYVQRGTTAPTRRPHRAARFPARLAGGA